MNVFSFLCDIPAEVNPDHVVIEDDQGSFTYAELSQASAGAASRLAGLGLSRGSVLMLMSTNRRSAVVAMLGAWRIGARVVWCNYRSGVEDAARLAEAAEPRVLCVESRYEAIAHAVVAKHAGLAVGLLPDDARYIAEPAGNRPADGGAELDDSAPALLMFTSGTTGRPKAVALTHGALQRMVELRGAMLAPGDPDPGANLIVAPLHHVAGISSLLSCLFTGRRAVLLAAFDPDRWIEAVDARSVTHAFVVPTMLWRIVQSPKLTGAALSTLRIVTYGGARAPKSLVLRALHAFPPHVGFINSYGLTETGATVCSLGPEDHRRALAGEEHLLDSVGKPLPGVLVKVVAANGADLSANESGDVWIRSPYGSQADAAGWTRTGDVGYVDAEGYLYLQGRRDELIIRGGENIAPREIEEVLRAHPEVLDCAVTAVPSEEWGQAIGALVVRRSPVSAAALIEHCGAFLSRNKRPDVIRFVGEIPRSDLGKAKTADLASLFSSSAVDSDAS